MSEFIRVTEQPSPYRHQEQLSVAEIVRGINNEDALVPAAVQKVLPQIEKMIMAISDRLLAGGRLFYIGAGTSGRLGILDASECPPTYGVPPDLVTGIIAGGKDAIIRSVEDAEDDTLQGWKDLQAQEVHARDFVVGIAASGTTPYVIGALQQCRAHGIATGCIACNANSPLGATAEYPVEVVVGPEFVTGSTRMKSGTAQKLILNMISTTVMIQLGRVEDNRMVNMQLNNEKLRDRGVHMLMEQTGSNDYSKARQLLEKYGSVKKAAEAFFSER